MSNSIRSLCFVISAAVIGLALTACTSATPKVTYYSLLGDDIAMPNVKRHDSLVLNVGPVNIPDVLKKTQIAIGGTDGLYRYSEYHRWAGGVDKEFARALAEQLASRLGTEKVYIFSGEQNIEPTCQVSLDVLEMNGELGREAKLRVRWTLIDSKGKIAPVTRQSKYSEEPAGGGYDAWVKAQQQNINRLSEEIAALVKERIRPF